MAASNKSLSSIERRAILGLSMIYGLRMFGLFLVLPILAVYAQQFEQSTPLLIGMVLGVYGMSQAMLQIPFGLMSDKYGRRRIITIGLIIFAIGSFVAAFADDIYWLLLGRFLQGSGAIAAAVLALTADLTRENQRAKAMAIIGMTIGLSFMLALVLAAPLVKLVGMSGLFMLTAALALLAILALWSYVPRRAPKPSRDVKFVASDFIKLFKNAHLWRLNISIFVLHCVLITMFVVVPLLLVERANLAIDNHWQVYLPVLLLSVVFMLPIVWASSNKDKVMRLFLVAILVLIAAQLLFLFTGLNSVYSIALSLLVFFVGFNALEAMLPSLVTRLAPSAMKGTAVGVYNTFQFSGVFVGGVVGGYLMGEFGVQGVFLFCLVLLVLWVVVIYSAPPVKLYDSRLIKLAAQNSAQGSIDSTDNRYAILLALDGVKDVTIIDEEQLAYLKIDSTLFDEQQIVDLDFVNMSE